jgi:chromosome partitioning protein
MWQKKITHLFLESMTEAVDYVRQRFNPKVRLLGYLVSRYKARRSYQQTYLQQLRRHFGPKVFDTVISDLAGFERSVTDAVPITQHDRRGRAASIARQFFDEACRRMAEGQSQSGGGVPTHRRAAAQTAA